MKYLCIGPVSYSLVDCCVIQPVYGAGSYYVRWRYYPLPDPYPLLEIMAVSAHSVYKGIERYALHRVTVSLSGIIFTIYAYVVQWPSNTLPAGRVCGVRSSFGADVSAVGGSIC